MYVQICVYIYNMYVHTIYNGLVCNNNPRGIASLHQQL